MTNRREILQAAAASALPLFARAVGTGEAEAPRHIALRGIIIDERYAASRTVGAHFASRGAAVHAILDGDITQIWLREIDPAWRREPVAVAGLTARPALFCLEQFALVRGMRVVFHGEHILHSDGETEHVLLRGGQAANLSVRDLRRAGPLWPVRLAHAITVHRRYSAQAQARFGRSDAALEPPLPPGAQLLTSWIIAAA